jgi:hypothetical protein
MTEMRSTVSKILPVLCVYVVLSLVGGEALAQAPPAQLIAVRDRFAGAVLSGDAKAAAALAYFPLENTVYGGPPHLTKGEFMKHFEKDEDWGNCLAKGKLAKEAKRRNTDSINCDQGNNIYYFG